MFFSCSLVAAKLISVKVERKSLKHSLDPISACVMLPSPAGSGTGGAGLVAVDGVASAVKFAGAAVFFGSGAFVVGGPLSTSVSSVGVTSTCSPLAPLIAMLWYFCESHVSFQPSSTRWR